MSRLFLALLLLTALGCGRFGKDPKEEGAGMPIEITEEHPVDAPGLQKGSALAISVSQEDSQ